MAARASTRAELRHRVRNQLVTWEASMADVQGVPIEVVATLASMKIQSLSLRKSTSSGAMCIRALWASTVPTTRNAS